MLFSAYLGKNRAEEWQKSVERHAQWLRMTTKFHTRDLHDGRVISLAWITSAGVDFTPSIVQSPGYTVLDVEASSALNASCTKAEDAWEHILGESWLRCTRFGVSLETGEVRVNMPLSTPDQFFYSCSSEDSVFGNDLRFMVRWAGLSLDERAVFAYMQHASIPWPLTVSTSVQRVPPGYSMRMTSVADISLSPDPEPVSRIDRSIGGEEAERLLLEALDSSLKDVPQSSVLFFSGGVDSGLLAWRLAELGRHDVALFNCSFGGDDKEGALAAQMAVSLGMTLKQTVHDPTAGRTVLDRLALDYTFPFSDPSVVPTNMLVQGCMDNFDGPTTVIDGTGADGLFAVGTKAALYDRIYSIPKPLRALMSSAYLGLGIWKHDSPMERRFRVMRRSSYMSLECAAITGDNALEGYLFHTPEKIRRHIDHLYSSFFAEAGQGSDKGQQLMLLDLAHVCAGRAAAKVFNPLRARGWQIVYPFMEPSMLRLGSSLPWEMKCRDGVHKSILKKLLVRGVPEEMVYRAKSGFTPPFSDILGDAGTQRFVDDVVMDSSNPLWACYERALVEKTLYRLKLGEVSSTGAFNFIWSLISLSGWLQQLEI